MRIIAIGVVVFTLTHTGAAAQTAEERARILRDFQLSVAEYAMHATPAPRIFTPPVAMVFRQEIAKVLSARDRGAAINGVGDHPHPRAFAPFPAAWLQEFPRVLSESLPPLPATLEYRLVGHDLVIRDKGDDVIVAVLRDAVGSAAAHIQ